MPEPSRARAVGLVLGLALLFAGAYFWLSTRKPSAAVPRAAATSSTRDQDEPELTRLRGEPSSDAAAAASARAEPAYTPPTVTTRDRELRERARERILHALTKDAPVEAGVPVFGVPTDAPVLDKDYIRQRVRGDFFPMAKECYEAALEREGGLAGRMVFQFVIVGDESVGGIVESAELDPSSTLAEAELVTCMRESLLSVTFPPPPKGGRVTVTYPFTLSPDDGG